MEILIYETMQNPMRHGDGVVESPNPAAETGNFGKEHETDRDFYSHDGFDSASENSEIQAGVKRIEAVSKAWTKTSLIVAYVT